MNKKISFRTLIFSILLTLINIVSFVICWIVFSEDGSLYRATFITYRLLFITYLLSFLFFGYVFDAFAYDRRKITENLYSTFLCNLLSLFIFYFLETLAFREFFSPLYIVVYLITTLIENIFLLAIFNRLIFTNYKKKRTYVFYHDNIDLTNIRKLMYFDIKYDICKKIKAPVDANIELNCDTVFISGISVTVRDVIIKHCLENNIEVFVFPSIDDVIVSGGKYVEELSVPMIKIDNSSTDLLYAFFKRVFDISMSFIALVLLSPFMLITALAIKIYDRGPVLYKQIRLTKNGKEFVIYKFRSMKVDAEKDGVARISTKNDDRITPIGMIIRAIRFDELPQLFNILKGDMSIVGPRPERPEIAAKYKKKYPSFDLRLQVKAGLTGYAQVYGRYNSNPDDKLKMDLFYINKMSFLYDLKLCFMTIKILFMKESTEAIDEGKTTAGD